MQAILDEVPATFISSPTWHVGVSNRNGMTNYEPWGSDYHVIKETMPASDWPNAIINERVYTLDSTMNSNGGIDWDESRAAEPDSMIHDFIAVLHPVNDNYSPSGLNYLRHAASGVSVENGRVCSVTTRGIHAATCEQLNIPTKKVAVIAGTTSEATTSATETIKEDGITCLCAFVGMTRMLASPPKCLNEALIHDYNDRESARKAATEVELRR